MMFLVIPSMPPQIVLPSHHLLCNIKVVLCYNDKRVCLTFHVYTMQSITGMFESAQCVLLKQKYASESRIMQLRTPACLKVLDAKSS